MAHIVIVLMGSFTNLAAIMFLLLVFFPFSSILFSYKDEVFNTKCGGKIIIFDLFFPPTHCFSFKNIFVLSFVSIFTTIYCI